jgi:uncharacterized protein (DUF2267 family)
MQTFDDLTDYVLAHTAIEQRSTAVHWLEETLCAFAKCLTLSEAQRLSLELPPPASHWIRNVEHERMVGEPDALYERVRRRLDVKASAAMETVRVVVLAMARALRPETREWLAQRMGEAWAGLLEEPSDTEGSSSRPARSLSTSTRSSDRARTLAGGKPGSQKPLSESAPEPQPDSVAYENPYSERKLSSATSAHGDPLSEGRPRSEHPVSESE